MAAVSVRVWLGVLASSASSAANGLSLANWVHALSPRLATAAYTAVASAAASAAANAVVATLATAAAAAAANRVRTRCLRLATAAFTAVAIAVVSASASAAVAASAEAVAAAVASDTAVATEPRLAAKVTFLIFFGTFVSRLACEDFASPAGPPAQDARGVVATAITAGGWSTAACDRAGAGGLVFRCTAGSGGGSGARPAAGRRVAAAAADGGACAVAAAADSRDGRGGAAAAAGAGDAGRFATAPQRRSGRSRRMSQRLLGLSAGERRERMGR
jgi:hypothetical protein